MGLPSDGPSDASAPPQAIAAEPCLDLEVISDAESACRLGRALLAADRIEAARAMALCAEELDRTSAETKEFCAEVALKAGDLALARSALEEALLLDRRRWPAREALARLYERAGARDDAISTLEDGLALQPLPRASRRLGFLLIDALELDRAAAALQAAITGGLSDPQLHYNLGWTLKELGDHEAAAAEFERALRLDQGHAGARFNLAQCLLAMQRDERGFALYESRWQCPGMVEERHGLPRWDGAIDTSLRLLVTLEQGLGDAIFFGRWLPLARTRVGRITLLAEDRVGRLLARAMGVDDVVPHPRYAHAGAVIPIGSLPSAMGVKTRDDAPAPLTFSSAPAASPGLIEWLADAPKDLIGLHWQGNPKYPGDAARSMRLAQLAPLAERFDGQLVSLQHGPAALQINEVPFTVLNPPLEGDAHEAFADTAAILRRVRALVTTDTAIAHFAGSLGVRTHLLLSHPCEWRFGRTGSKTSFYPSLELHRQSIRGDWSDALASLVSSLRACE